MKDEKILENEILSDEELENISGGTLDESIEILKTIIAKTGYATISTQELPGYMKRNFGIDVETDGRVTWDKGTANIYKYNGETIEHKKVIEIIKAKERCPIF